MRTTENSELLKYLNSKLKDYETRVDVLYKSKDLSDIQKANILTVKIQSIKDRIYFLQTKAEVIVVENLFIHPIHFE
jgi:hypothetical protein